MRLSLIQQSIFIIISLTFIRTAVVSSKLHELKRNFDIVEGDIIVDRKIQVLISSPTDRRSRRDVAKLNEHRWKHGVVPYTFAKTMSSATRVAIIKGMDEFHQRTCLWFTPRVNETDYVHFIQGDGCYSSVGRQGGEQTVSIGPGCSTRNTMLHELMHTIGFFHEQSRFDRDLYVKVLWWNLEVGAEKNFHTYSHGKLDTLGMPYDFNSLMHYKNKDFSKNYKDTIQAIDNPTKPLGNNQGFSKMDLKQILKFYKCEKKKYHYRAAQCKDKAPGVCLLFKAYPKYCRKFKSYTSTYCRRTCRHCQY